MNRRSLFTVFVAAGLIVGISGCKNSADQAAQQAGPDAGSSASGSASSASNSTIGKLLAPAPKPIVIPAGTAIPVVLDQSIGSKTSTTGQDFTATVRSPIEVGGRLAIPKGARASGIVKDAKSAGRFKGGAVLELTLTSVTVGGTSYDIQTSVSSTESKGKGKRTAGMVGGGAGGGALIGGLAGGGKGALIGGLIGAGAGTAGAGLSGNREITLPAESPITFKLLQPLELKPKS
jgi:hypothetical protein